MSKTVPNFGTLDAKYSNIKGKSSSESRSFAQVDSVGGIPMSDREYFELILDRIAEKRIDVTYHYQDWLHCLFGIATEFGEEGRDYAHKISMYYVGPHSKYDPQEVDRQYDECLAKGRKEVTIASVIKLAKDYGVDVTMPDGRYPENLLQTFDSSVKSKKKVSKKKDCEDVISVIRRCLKTFADFRRNEITGVVELLDMADSKRGWKQINDVEFDTLYTRLKAVDSRITQTDVKSVINSKTFHKTYNPIRDYLDSLPLWNPKEHEGEDPISDFFNFVHFVNGEQEYAQKYCRKWFLNFVALLKGQIQSNQLMLAFLGDMGTGKTWFCKHILPLSLSQYFHIILPNDKLDKDQLINMSNYALIDFDEFKVTSKNSNQIKSILSIEKTNVRAPYERFPKTRLRLCSFVATANEKVYLSEAAGDRRYISLIVEGTDEIGEYSLPYDAAYAQALYEISLPDYKSCLSKEEVREVSEHNQDFVEPDLCMAAVSKFYRSPSNDEIGIKVTATDVMMKVGAFFRSPDITLSKIGIAMTQLGFAKTKTGNKSRYYVMEIQPGEDEEECRIAGQKYYYESKARQASEQTAAELQRKEAETKEDIFHSAAIDDLYSEHDDEDFN